MGWRNQIDIVATQFILEVQHPVRQGEAVNFISFLVPPVLTYLIILTIDTSHIAVAEEDGPRPPGPGKGRLLAVMSARRRNYGQTPGMTIAQFILQSVDAALARADIARGQPGLKRLRTALQFTGTV
jgi:hypothetical protein